jgi:hypothetical protein
MSASVTGLAGYVVLRAEQVGDLVVAVAHDRFLERHEVGPELAKTLDEYRPTLGPRPAPPPQVQRGDAHHARAVFLLQREPPDLLTSAGTCGSSIVLVRTKTSADFREPTF